MDFSISFGGAFWCGVSVCEVGGLEIVAWAVWAFCDLWSQSPTLGIGRACGVWCLVRGVGDGWPLAGCEVGDWCILDVLIPLFDGSKA